jgi:hypothetical protein
MILETAEFAGKAATISKEGNVWWITGFPTLKHHTFGAVTLKFHGTPRVANLPPWDGGFVWGRDSSGKGWTAIAVQGQGASCWWPCKDYQADEPDMGVITKIKSTDNNSVIISNGLFNIGRKDTS